MAKRTRQKTISRTLADKANAYFKAKYSNDVTRKSFCSNYKKFIRFCREKYQCKTEAECREHIKDYAEHLSNDTAFTPSTIHSYLAPVCIYHGINMQTIQKPIRCTADYTRGRSGNGRTERKDNDITNSKYQRLAEFQIRVGIRRAELKRLTGADLVTDESGELCVRVERGKGGKMQLQRILPQDKKFVADYFKDKQSSERIFSADEMKNKLNLHRLRALCAQNACKYYSQRLESEGEAYRQQLIREIKARWNTYNINPKTGKPKPINKRLLSGKYFLRGKNKKFAKQHGLPTAYDRLVLTAVSIFHLSHWRNDVSAESYLIAL